MGVEETRRAIEQLVRARGEKAERLWNLVAGFHPSIDPRYALNSLENLVDNLRVEFQEEARILARNIRDLLNNPPFP